MAYSKIFNIALNLIIAVAFFLAFFVSFMSASKRKPEQNSIGSDEYCEISSSGRDEMNKGNNTLSTGNRLRSEDFRTTANKTVFCLMLLFFALTLVACAD